VTQALPLLISAVVERSDRVRAAVEAHFDAIWRFSRRMGVAERDAEDAAQQVFLVFSQKVDTVTTGAERAFLFATALRVAADCRKKSNRAREVMLEGEAQPVDDAHAEPGAERALAEKRLLACVDRVLEELVPELREVFVLVELEEMTMAETARALAVPPGTVASRLRRARELFQEKALVLKASLKGLLP
jgi:RNA polymerase sigma-70 factor (ECF subfamily)